MRITLRVGPKHLTSLVVALVIMVPLGRAQPLTAAAQLRTGHRLSMQWNVDTNGVHESRMNEKDKEKKVRKLQS